MRFEERARGRVTARELRELMGAGAEDRRALEGELAQRVDVPHAALVPSCRVGVVRVLHALGVRPGAEVLVSAYNYPPLIERIARAGFRPVTIDTAPGTTSIDPAAVAARVGPRTEAILATHAFGRPAPMQRLSEIAGRAGVALVADAAQALGSGVGRRSDATVFSFGPTKPLACWGGGAVVTPHADVARAVGGQRGPASGSPLGRGARWARGAVFELVTRGLHGLAMGTPIDRLAERWTTDPVGAVRARPWQTARFGPAEARLVRIRLRGEREATRRRRHAHRRSTSRLAGSWTDAPGGNGFGLLVDVYDAEATGRALRQRSIDAGWGELRNIGGEATPRAAALERRLLRLPVATSVARRVADLTRGTARAARLGL